MEREYYPLTKAAEIAKREVEDLINFGAIGKLSIYVFVNGYPGSAIMFKQDPSPRIDVHSAETDTSGICKFPLTGLHKLTSDCLQRFELDNDDKRAMIDFNHTLNYYPADKTKILVRPEPEIMLSIEKLFILHDDIKLLKSADSPNDNYGTVSKKSMLRLILGLAVGGYKFDPSNKRNDKLADMKIDLDLSRVRLSNDTIRSILNEAADIPKDEPYT